MNRWLLSLAIVIVAADARVRTQSGYAGDWNLVVDNTEGRIPGLGPAAQLTIEISDDVVAVRTYPAPPEIYRRGVATPLDGARTGRLTLSDAAMTLTRERFGSDAVTVVTDEYMLLGNDLIVTRTLRVERGGVPTDTPQNRWQARYIRQ
jgi:hypothetical protein